MAKMDVGSLDENLQLGEDCKNLDVSPTAAKSSFEVMTDTNDNGAEVHSPQITENHGFHHVDLNEQDHKDSPMLPDLHEEGLNYHSLTSKDKNLEVPCSSKYTGLCDDDTVAASPDVSDAVRSPLRHEIFLWQEEGEQHCSFGKHCSLAQDQEFQNEADIEHSSRCLPGVSSCGGQDDIQNTGLHSADISRTSNAEADKFFHVEENDDNPKHPIARKDDIYHSEALYFENQDKIEGENDIEFSERDQREPSSLRKERSVSPAIALHVQGSQEETAGIVNNASPWCHLNTPENPSVGFKGSPSPDFSLPVRGHISSSNCESQVDSHQHADSLHINSVHKSHSPQRESHRRGDSSPGASYHEAGCPASGSHHQAEFPPRESDRQAISPQKRLSSSPRRRDSSRRKGRSRSLNRHRDSSEHKRARHGRSRSRSPHAMDRYGRSPRRRHSPRHRSPPGRSRSRRHSPVNRGRPAQSNRSSGVGRPGKNLFIAGFSFGTTERDLDRKFSRFGRVTDVRIVRDKRSGDSRGFGFLSLERDEDADAAIRAFDHTEWNGRILLVEKSKSFVR